MPRRRSPRSPAWAWGEEAGYYWNRIGPMPDPPASVPSHYRRLWRSGFLAGMATLDRQRKFAIGKTKLEAAQGIGMIRLAKRIEKQRRRDAERGKSTPRTMREDPWENRRGSNLQSPDGWCAP